MKPPRKERQPIMIKYEPYKGFVIVGQPGRKLVFATKMDAENYCLRHYKEFPIVEPTQVRYQDLPKNSVWTGAPWDNNFKDLR